MSTAVDLRTHEIVERRAVARLVRKGDRVLEGGAGIGAVTRVLLDAGANVTAYEPGLLQFEQLHSLKGAYPQTLEVIRAALSDHDGEIPLHIYEAEVWYADRTVALGGHVPTRTERVPATDFHELLHSQPWDGLVLDIEGAEHELLANAIWPKSLRWVVAELHGSPCELARTVNNMHANSFTLEGLEVHEVYLVAGWVRV